jgi:hypothetical protein
VTPRERLELLAKLDLALAAEIARPDFWNDDEDWTAKVTALHASTMYRAAALEKRLYP